MLEIGYQAMDKNLICCGLILKESLTLEIGCQVTDRLLICCGLYTYGLILKESLVLEIGYYSMDKHLICFGLILKESLTLEIGYQVTYKLLICCGLDGYGLSYIKGTAYVRDRLLYHGQTCGLDGCGLKLLTIANMELHVLTNNSPSYACLLANREVSCLFVKMSIITTLQIIFIFVRTIIIVVRSLGPIARLFSTRHHMVQYIVAICILIESLSICM